MNKRWNTSCSGRLQSSASYHQQPASYHQQLIISWLTRSRGSYLGFNPILDLRSTKKNIDDVNCTAKTRRFQKKYTVHLVVSRKNGRVGSASYAGAMAMRPMICQYLFFCFSLGLGNMVGRLALTIAMVQCLKCQSKLSEGVIDHRHNHGRIRKKNIWPTFPGL